MGISAIAQSSMHKEETPNVLEFSDSIIRHCCSLVALQAEDTDADGCLADCRYVICAVANRHYSAALTDVFSYELHQIAFLARTHPAENLRNTLWVSHCRNQLCCRRRILKKSVQNVTLDYSTELALARDTTELIQGRPASHGSLVLRPKSCDVITGLGTQDAELRIVRDQAATLPNCNCCLKLVSGDHTNFDLRAPHCSESALYSSLQLVFDRCDSNKVQFAFQPGVEFLGQPLSVAQLRPGDSLHFTFEALPLLGRHFSVSYHQYAKPFLSERLSPGQQLLDHGLVLILRTTREDERIRSFHVNRNWPNWSAISKTASLNHD
mmetsp:Transcript_22097/g.48438  ORF Transcript_22097/g.48438 Transcript_22097/m.48438 type:complete len:324 (-) Transcript_22097:155-1126(-)